MADRAARAEGALPPPREMTNCDQAARDSPPALRRPIRAERIGGGSAVADHPTRPVRRGAQLAPATSARRGRGPRCVPGTRRATVSYLTSPPTSPASAAGARTSVRGGRGRLRLPPRGPGRPLLAPTSARRRGRRGTPARWRGSLRRELLSVSVGCDEPVAAPLRFARVKVSGRGFDGGHVERRAPSVVRTPAGRALQNCC